jgi:hypothetical protein
MLLAGPRQPKLVFILVEFGMLTATQERLQAILSVGV